MGAMLGDIPDGDGYEITRPSQTPSTSPTPEPIESLVESFTNNLPIKATEIGWEKIGEDMQEVVQAIKALITTHQNQLLDRLLKEAKEYEEWTGWNGKAIPVDAIKKMRTK